MTPAPPPHQTYDNATSSVPSHWIPFYGSAFTLFYDPLLSLFVGDGPPRRSIHRPWDGSLPSAPSPSPGLEIGSAPPCAFLDDIHVQPMVMVDRYLDAQFRDGDSRFFCFCIQVWRAGPHRCPPGLVWPVVPLVVPPKGGVPVGWVWRDIPVKDTGYVDDEEMHKFANQVEDDPKVSEEDPVEELSARDQGSRSTNQDRTRAFRNQRQVTVISPIMEESMEESSEDSDSSSSASSSSASSSSTYYTAFHTME
ncbi:MAG: hypothetical protein Q9195_000807 [Heterodermia aff. obscurata]